MSDERTEDSLPATNLDDLAAFVERMVLVAQRAGVSSLDIKTDDVRIKLRSGQVVEASLPVATPLPAIVDFGSFEPGPAEPNGYAITSPMVGTYYRSTSPSEPPLVEVGDRVEAGQLIGIIEAMKIMNEITSDRAGTVIEIVAANATAVEYGTPLIRLGP